MSETYTNRHQKIVTVATVEDEGRVVTWTDGWTFGGIPDEHRHLMRPGAEFVLETRQFSMVVGMAADGMRWLWRKSDADLDREHADFVARMNADREERLASSMEEWARREAALPLALRRRLERFRANGGHEFNRDGWGYELVVSELAVVYAANDQQDDANIDRYARLHGTSGNQHDYAKALSRLLTDDIGDQDAVANSVSALSPLTGDADYSLVTL